MGQHIFFLNQLEVQRGTSIHAWKADSYVPAFEEELKIFNKVVTKIYFTELLPNELRVYPAYDHHLVLQY